ncbi:hypothetical protein FRC02_010133 [Tulasnella sp. 418]|nr:hypothetical protein FRC02_010133 [Tulasnella sp. 418]
MSTSSPPPILEVEDQPESKPRPESPPPTDPPSIQPLPTSKEQHKHTSQGIDIPPPHINDHAVFWSTYNKEAEEFDAEMLKGWNDSLDVLLIFAGLFSAVNTAFIIESYRGLSPDPVETTNALLRLLITHRNDNSTLTAEDLDPIKANPSTFPTNYIFFASLYASLSAAFGAVTAKQWLTEYSNKGPAKAPHVLGLHRIMKFKGLEDWHFQFIMDLLPLLLQISLALFLVGVVNFLWVLNWKIGMMQLILVVGGIVVYVATVIIGVISSAAPFRTPLTKYIRNVIDILMNIKFMKPGSWIEAMHDIRLSITVGEYDDILEDLLIIPLSLISDGLRRIAGVLSDLGGKAWSFFPTLKKGKAGPKWTKQEKRAAESVLTRLYRTPIAAENIQRSSSLAIRLLIAHNISGVPHGSEDGIRKSCWLISILKAVDFSSKTEPIRLELSNGLKESGFSDLSTLVSLHRTALDALMIASFEHYLPWWRRDSNTWNQVPWSEVPQILQAILQIDSSPFIISHVAILIAAIRLMIRSHVDPSFKSNPPEDDEDEPRQHIMQMINDMHRARMVKPYIETALSLVGSPGDDIFCTSSANIYYNLLTSTKELYRRQPSQDFSFYASLLRLSRVSSSNDSPTQNLIIELLSFWENWGVQEVTQYKDDIVRLLKFGFSSSPAYQSLEDPDSPLHKLSYQLAYNLTDDLFLHIFPAVYSGLTMDDTIGTPISLINAPQFIRNRVLRSDPSRSPDPKVAYNSQIALALVITEQQQDSKDLLSLLYFVNKMQDTELRWPVYFPSPQVGFTVEKVDQLIRLSPSLFKNQEEEFSSRINRIMSETHMETSSPGECIVMLWRGASKAFREGRLPDDWNDATFFQPSVVDMMTKHYHRIKQHRYVEVNRGALCDYFKKALEKGWQPNSDNRSALPKTNSSEDQSPVSSEDVAEIGIADRLAS